MTVEEILAFARGLLGDQRQPYLWSQDELLLYYNHSVDDICRRVKHLRDNSTSSVCQINILSGVHSYSNSSKIVEIISAKLSSQGSPLTRKSEFWMDSNVWSWRSVVGTPSIIIPEIEKDKFRLYPYFAATYVVEGSTNIGFNSATKTINKSTGGLSIFAVNDKISVSGTANNNNVFTAVTVSDTAITVSETVVDEAATSAVLRKVMDTLNLSVARLPLTWVTIGQIGSSTPPIDEDFHFDLIHGIMAKAYLKDGSETYDPNQGAKHQGLFEVLIGKFKKERIGKLYFEQTIGPHPGTI